MRPSKTKQNGLFIKGRLAVLVPRGEWSPFGVPVEGEEAYGESQRVEDLVLHGGDEDVQLGQFGADAPGAQVGMPSNGPEMVRGTLLLTHISRAQFTLVRSEKLGTGPPEGIHSSPFL